MVKVEISMQNLTNTVLPALKITYYQRPAVNKHHFIFVPVKISCYQRPSENIDHLIVPAKTTSYQRSPKNKDQLFFICCEIKVNI